MKLPAGIRPRLTPVGERVPGRSVSNPSCNAATETEGMAWSWTSSGTAALAVAVAASLDLNDRESVDVILPGYGCPDLVAAVRHAGGNPVFVDTAADSPFYSFEKLAEVLDKNTAAVIAVDFLGLSEDICSLGALCAERQLVLIEDSAQRLPTPDIPACVDAVIHSFGRGKPAGVLAGGAIKYRPKLCSAVEKYVPATGDMHTDIRWRLEVAVYNLGLSPSVYGVVSRLPGLGLGDTRYTPLRRVDGLSSEIKASALRAIAAQRLSSGKYTCGLIRDGLLKVAGQVVDVAGSQNAAESSLLRYPILMPDTKTAESAWKRLHAAGLGATRMYGAALADIPGVDCPTVKCPNARDFAGRLVTLPVHSRVRPVHIRQMMDIIASEVG